MLEIFDGIRRLWEMGFFFLGLGRILGVGIAYVTSFENFASFLFGVGAVSFISLLRVTFLFRVAAAYVICGEVFGEHSNVRQIGRASDVRM